MRTHIASFVASQAAESIPSSIESSPGGWFSILVLQQYEPIDRSSDRSINDRLSEIHIFELGSIVGKIAWWHTHPLQLTTINMMVVPFIPPLPRHPQQHHLRLINCLLKYRVLDLAGVIADTI